MSSLPAPGSLHRKPACGRERERERERVNGRQAVCRRLDLCIQNRPAGGQSLVFSACSIFVNTFVLVSNTRSFAQSYSTMHEVSRCLRVNFTDVTCQILLIQILGTRHSDPLVEVRLYLL